MGGGGGRGSDVLGSLVGGERWRVCRSGRRIDWTAAD